jgi:sphingomyelin phosphodiesterase
MVHELQEAEDAGQRAWIIGHIPLGKEDILVDQVRYSRTESLFCFFKI